MDALSMHFNFQVLGNPIQDEELWKKLLTVPSLCLRNSLEPTIINSGADKLLICSKAGSHVLVHVYCHGLITIDIQHVEQPSTPKMIKNKYSYKVIQDLEKTIKDLLGKSNCQYSRSIPTALKREKVCPYFLRGDNTLLEYEPLQLVFEKDSKWQNIKIYKTESFGHILCLNEDLMLGESDLIYTNTLLGLERSNNFKDKTVLILGGGDGGLLHELIKLNPQFTTMVEIDEEVIKACRKHMRKCCGNCLDTLNGPNYSILVDNCVTVLEKYQRQGLKFDYVINDLSEYLLDTEVALSYDAKTNAIILELSMQILGTNGKYLSRGNCITATEALKCFENDVSALGLKCKSFIIDVPSFMEKYCLFEVTRPSETTLVDGEC